MTPKKRSYAATRQHDLPFVAEKVTRMLSETSALRRTSSIKILGAMRGKVTASLNSYGFFQLLDFE